MKAAETSESPYVEFDARPRVRPRRSLRVSGPCSLLATKYDAAMGDPRIAHLERDGHGRLAFASMHGDMDAFIVPSLGYIPFTRKSLVPICLGDPICHPRVLSAFVRDALEFMDVRSFIYISRRTAKVLHEFGFSINELGTETFIDVRRFGDSSTHAAKLMRSVEQAVHDRIVVYEDLRCHLCVRRYDRNFVDGHPGPVRCDNPGCDSNTRKFVARIGGIMVGHVVFEPVYDNGCVIGYGVSSTSSAPDRSYNVCDHIITRALSHFQQEGVDTVSIGLSPFHEIADDGEFRYSEPLKRTLRWMYRNSDTFGESRSLAFHDEQVRSTVTGIRQRKVYCASLDQFPVLDLYALLQGRGLNPSSDTMASALRSIECALAPNLLDI